MSFDIRREQAFALRKSQYAAQLKSALTGTKVRTSTDPRNGDLLLTDAAGRATRITTGANGLPSSATTPAGRTYRSEIGDDGRLRGLTNPAGYHIELEYDAAGRVSRLSAATREVWRLRYDELGRAAAIEYADATTTEFRYASTTKGLAVTNRLGKTDTFAFDGSKLVSVVDGNGNETRFEYGAWDRPDRAILSDGSVETYSYDKNGAVSGINWATSAAVASEHAPGGKLSLLRFGDGQILRFAYDDVGHPVAAATADCETRFRWSQTGGLEEESQEGSSIRYTYGDTGNLEAMTYRGGDVARFEYDVDGHVVSATDWSGARYTYQHLDKDRGYVQSCPSGLTATVALSPRGTPTSTVVHSRTRGRLFATTVTYDERFRAASIDDSDFGGRRFSYDAEGQLLSTRGPESGQDESFSYDAVGNRVDSNGTAASFGSLNQLLTYGGAACSYDARGNTVAAPARGGRWMFAWDQRNLLVSAAGPAGERLTFGYDAFGRRIWKRQAARIGKPETITRYTWAGEQLITQITQGGSGVRRQDFLYMPGTFVPIATRIDGRVYTYHCDHRGAPTRITDGLGNVVWAAVYSAFGQAEVRQNNIENPLRLPGQWEDSETGLHVNRFRYYSPLFGRYLSRDPLSIVAGPNLYAYVSNDPINRIDPLGLWSGWDVATAVGAGLAAAAVVVAIAVTAPVSVPALIIAAGAAAMGVGVGLGTYKAITLKDPDPSTIGKAFLSGFVDGALFTAAVVGAMVLAPEAATAIAIGAAGLGIYGMCSEHFGWADGSVPFSEMTPEQQNKSVGGLWGGILGSLAVGGAVARGSKVLADVGDMFAKGFDEGVASYPKEAQPKAVNPPNEPARGSLTDIQTRDWYLPRLEEIDVVEQQMRAEGRSSKDIFETTWRLRNEAKLQARALMKNRAVADSLPPPLTQEGTLAKYGGDYEKAIAASKRSNPKVNQSIEERRAKGEE